MGPRTWIVFAALLGAVGVSAGAYGAHGLEGGLQKLGVSQDEMPKRLKNFDTAVRYQMIHALALLGVGLLAITRPSCTLNLAGVLLLLGILLFPGSLYALVFGGPKYLGHVAASGGVSLILGWLALAAAGICKPK